MVFVQFPTVSYADEDAGTCLRVAMIDPQDFGINGGVLAEPDGTTFLDRTEPGGQRRLPARAHGRRHPDRRRSTSSITSATDGEGTIEVDGDTETATVEQPGAIFTLEFELDAGRRLLRRLPPGGLRRPRGRGTCLRAAILDPGGHQHQRQLPGRGRHHRSSTRHRSATGGTYQIVIDGDSTQMGEVDVQVTSTD